METGSQPPPIPAPGNLPRKRTRSGIRTLQAFHKLVRNPSLLGLCPDCHSHAKISGRLHVDRTQLTKVLSGHLPIGPAMVARVTLFLPPAEACQLIECYLADELDQIADERTGYQRKFALPQDGGFALSLAVRKVPPPPPV